MRDDRLRVVFASWPEEEFLVAEIWDGDDYVGDVRRDAGNELVASLSPTGGAIGGIPLEELEDAMAVIRRRLTFDDSESA